jgi:hypothetical protein
VALFLSPPKAWAWLLPAIAAALLWLASMPLPLPPWAAWCILCTSALLAAQATLQLAAWIAVMKAHLRLYDSPDALWYSALSEARRLAESIYKMSDLQLQSWMIAMYNSAAKAGAESEELDTFIQRFMDSLEAQRALARQSRAQDVLNYAAKNNGWLPAVRDTSDGSTDRMYLADAIRKLVSAGAADPAAGPNPARVKDWKKAAEVLK